MTAAVAEDLRFAVLQSRAEIQRAEADLSGEGFERPRGLREKLGARFPHIALRVDAEAAFRSDALKSWDVLRTVRAIRARLAPSDPVLDVGCFASAICPALQRLGHTRLAGIDLDPRVSEMPGAGLVDYRVGDLMHTPWENGSFAAVTAISVIEHGVADEALLAEVSRLLRPGGVFLFSTDYWPDKIDTRGIDLFGLPWRIFSRAEIDALVERAAGYDLRPSAPLGELAAGAERPIRFAQRDYTFLFGALTRV